MQARVRQNNKYLRRNDRFGFRHRRFIAASCATCKDAGACEIRANGGNMKKTQKKPRQGGLYYYEAAYSLELARGASHISSMLSAATQESAVHEVMREFIATHGRAELDAFCWLLAERLDKRGCAAAAMKARDFDASRRMRALACAS
ncbi:hypothetical protein [Paraburkholderia sp. J10-1]|uniref:hypothetical protein n=1 Tax=Paraburkholderia sp. J10-1 TaxID=2805430 RepID=UPI002AB63424|nr:hypothetical protein [Paraburkholderia sp. J10-1]